MDLEWPRGDVKDGKEPEVGQCFCERKSCMFRKIEIWQGSKDPTACVVCETRGTTRWRRPGSFLYSLRIVFSQPNQRLGRRLPMGMTLTEDSILCQACYMVGFHHNDRSRRPKQRVSAADELELLDGLAPPRSHRPGIGRWPVEKSCES